ncbi:unnamed protein product [Mesocestoides corti]|uniref:Uncharacterized protein n=1 Tax=Mesocestoides corti TaxID=53468 RepID=A0A0R3URR5_MESCO|nr:unnamed protein product [Mesocestoides corti]
MGPKPTVATSGGADILDHTGSNQSCVSAFQWHARKISNEPEKDTTEQQYVMSGVASVVSGILQCRRLRAQTYLTTLASANRVSLCVPMACEEDRQPTSDRYLRDAVHNERCGQRGGLGWTAPGSSSFLGLAILRRCVMTAYEGCHLGVQPLIESQIRDLVTASHEDLCDFRLRGPQLFRMERQS